MQKELDQKKEAEIAAAKAQKQLLRKLRLIYESNSQKLSSVST